MDQDVTVDTIIGEDEGIKGMRKKEQIMSEYLVKTYGKARCYEELEVHSAFIVFENQVDHKLCLKRYKWYQGWLGRCRRMPSELLLGGKVRLKVKKATDPAEILWENVEDSRCSQCARKTWSTSVAVFLILLSASAIYSIKIY